MQFHYDANQEFQLRALNAIADLFDGQPRMEVDLTSIFTSGMAAISNRLDLGEDTLLENLRMVQEQNGIKAQETLEVITAEIETPEGLQQVRFPNYSVEMETGTGKTYVYLRTALQLYADYGMRKFIVIVPSVAIREGVLKTLRMTETHFRRIYQNPPYRYYEYDSDNLTRVRQFALSDGVEIMVMTLDSFNKDTNVIRQSTDRLQGETPLHLIQAARPILILDEPQNMGSELSIQALSSLNPLFALRYSATHRRAYNLVYRLTPFDAYRQRLVKRIEVAGVEEVNNSSHPFIRVESTNSQKNKVIARLSVHQLMSNGRIQERTVTVKPGDSLADKANRDIYDDYVVDSIDHAWNSVTFSNGFELRHGESTGADKLAVWNAQIRYAVQEHFIKQRRFLPQRVKVLSLFFIDLVDNYVSPDAPIHDLFNKAFLEISAKFPDVYQELYGTRVVDPEKVQAGYFAKRQTRDGATIYEDSRTGTAQRDKEVYDLIMKEKERLLSFQEPVSFIFSHSALREGWDNPNVFQICTLNQSVSDIRKRQEIGRGMRLAVNQDGQRVQDERINVLTVVANESYQDYVGRLQGEYEEEGYGKNETLPIANARARKVISLNKAYTLRPEFQTLWDKVKQKTRYQVHIDTSSLIDQAVQQLDEEQIPAPSINISKVSLEVDEEDAFRQVLRAASRAPLKSLVERYPLPDLVALLQELLERSTPSVRLSRRTLLEIVRRSNQSEAILKNPQGFATTAARVIRQKLADQLVQGIKYEKTGEWYEMTLFKDEVERFEDLLVPVPQSDKSIYDHVIVDSDVERNFVQGLENDARVRLYVKFPNWFTVQTPVGEYNPDWGIVMVSVDEFGNEREGESLLYLVRETKDLGKGDDPLAPKILSKLRPDELRKTKCGSKHFAELGVDYEVIQLASELPAD